MPKISIREIDNTGSETREYQDYAVLIPAIKLECDLAEEGCSGTLDGLYESFEDFQDALDIIISHQTIESGSPSVPENFAKDIGFIMACECLNFGLAVQYWGAYNTVGDDGYSGDTEDDDKFEDLYNEFTDKGKYDLRFLTTGGFKSTAAKIAALNAAASRGDAKAVLDVNEDELNLDTTGAVTSGKFTTAIESWISESGIAAACGASVTRKGTSGSSWTVTETIGRYGKLLAPKIYAQDIKKCKIVPVTDDKGVITGYKSQFKGPTRLESRWTAIPASLNFLANFGYHVITATKKFNPWYAIAGSDRGRGAYTLSLPTVEFGDADIDKLQVREGDANEGHIATNVICNIRPYGYVLWGDRSMQPLSVPESAPTEAVQLTAASFANIRELCSSIKKTLYRAGRKYTFEPNSDELWFNFRSEITPLLDQMKSDQGVRGYEIVKESTSKKALMIATIRIIPNEPVEDFDLTVEMTDTIDSVTE